MAPPKIIIDWKNFDSLCAIQCSLREIATFFDCSEDTIERRVQEEKQMSFAEYFGTKRGTGRVSLRRKQYEIAMTGNVTMLIWLGKNWLDQRDKQEIEHTGANGGPIQYENLSQEEVEQRIRNSLAVIGVDVSKYQGH